MANQEFGTQFFKEMTVANYNGQTWSETTYQPSDAMSISPAAHVLHYASTCFEGMKAFRSDNGDILVFRLADHIKRMQNSARGLHLPVPDAAQLAQMITGLLDKYRDEVPEFPASAYIRPTLIGTNASIGRAAAPSDTALLYVLVSPVGDYFSLDSKMRVLLNTEDLRCAPHFGTVKSGGNYASALGLVMDARAKYQAEQVIFAPNGDVQETAAANCLLIKDGEVLTKGLSSEFLPGMTRDSILRVAETLGYTVNERDISADELMAWIKDGEVALSGTAAVLAPVAEIVYNGEIHSVNQGKTAEHTLKLRKALNDIQRGVNNDSFNWITVV